MDFHFDQKHVNIRSVKDLFKLLAGYLVRSVFLLLHLLERPDFGEDVLEPVTDALDQFIEVQSFEDKAIIVGFVENLESSERAEYVLHDREHFTRF